MLAELIGVASLGAWGYVIVGRGAFWRIRADEPPPGPATSSRSVAVIVPARNEAQVIGSAVGSLLGQNYSGRFHIVVVNDHSTDATAEVAAQAAAACGRSDRLTVMHARPLPDGWKGKLWAVSEGIRAVPQADYFLLTDADVVHDSDNLSAWWRGRKAAASTWFR